MPQTLQYYVARVTEHKAHDLIAAARAVPEDKQGSQILGRGRSVIDIVAECAVTNEMSIALLRERRWDEAGREARQKAHAALDTLDKACDALAKYTEALAAAIRALPDDHLELEVTLPGETSTVADDMLHSYWNMSYHEGQINYIRALRAPASVS